MQYIVNRLIDDSVVNVDKYVNNGSTWLIFTETKQWVIELTKDGTLWYNYSFFKDLFAYMSMDVVENQQYITKWVEDNIINGVKEARPMEEWVNSEKIVDKTIQNGVKHTDSLEWKCGFYIEDAIQNGVKHTARWVEVLTAEIEDTIQNGIKKTHRFGLGNEEEIEDAIQNGVKYTHERLDNLRDCVGDVIENGVKETKLGAPDNRDYFIGDAIKNGIKEVKELPDMSGELRGYGDYYRRQKDMAKPHILYVKDVIENGDKDTFKKSTY